MLPLAQASPHPLFHRLPPEASLLERIQAIARNVSDIGVKVDQILRNSLLLQGKGGRMETAGPSPRC